MRPGRQASAAPLTADKVRRPTHRAADGRLFSAL